ncbi:hypothetical protein ABW20_dc0105599 [Dactylellina cionopaga]|nr:hypothetical protein ABW20_dc0105599 [Dactylellina cionopaga]
MDGLDGFPNEVLALILGLLDFESLLKCHDVCRSWRKYSLYESNYLPHVLDAYTDLTHGNRPLPATLSSPEKTERLKELFRTSVSASPVFARCESLRDIAVVLHRLDGSWLAGNNTSFASLNHGDVHEMPVMSVAIDTKTGSIVTGDSGGIVAFWNVSTGRCYYKCRLQFSGPQRFVPLQIVIERDLMVMASAVGGMIVAVRNRSGGPEPFLRAGEFWTTSGQASRICMEGYVCIAGEVGAVSFWDLSRYVGSDPACLYPSASLLMTIDTKNDSLPDSLVYSMFYRDTMLYLGLGDWIQQIASPSRPIARLRGHGQVVKKQLWELEGIPYARLASLPEYRNPRNSVGHSRLCPIGRNGDILVSWADSSVSRLTSNMDDEIVWDPQSECLIPAISGPRASTQCFGIYARGEQVICRVRLNEIELFRGDGTPIGRIPCKFGNISCVAVDPAFIAVGTKEAALCIYYFAPGHQNPAHGQGPSSSATINALESPSLERKHTYKRKYREALGMDLESPNTVGTVISSGAGLRMATKSLAGDASVGLGLGPKANVKIPVPAP